jgi:GNAT superfamily N-acetyltransferase
MLIRTAVESDWGQVWPFFAEIVSAGETYAYPDPITEDVARSLWLEPPPSRTVVAVDGWSGPGSGAGSGAGPADQVLGSAKMGPNRPGRGSHIATASFMVNPAAQGRGVGRALAEHALAWAREAGYRGMQFNAVVESNVAAVHLWQALGFEIVGTVPGAFDHRRLGPVGLHVMYQAF